MNESYKKVTLTRCESAESAVSKGAPLELQTISRASLHIYLRKISQKNHKITHSDYITKKTVESADEPTGGAIQTTRGG